VLSRETKIKTKPISKRKTVQPGVREISPVSIYGEVYGGEDLRERCVFMSFVTDKILLKYLYAKHVVSVYA